MARSAPKPKLSLKQKILVCIGWSDPKEYVPIEMEDVEQGIRERSEEVEEEQDEGEKRESINKSSSSNHSRRTSEESYSVSRRGLELADRAPDTPSSHRGNSKHLETEFITPYVTSHGYN